MSERELTGLEVLEKYKHLEIHINKRIEKGAIIEINMLEQDYQIIKKELFRYYLYQNGIWTQLDDDKVLTHYNVLHQSQDKLLICYGSISWKTGENNYDTHIIDFNDYMNTWFLKKDKSE